MSERNEEAQRLAAKVVSGGIVQQAAERLVYQIVEVCAEHERDNIASLRAENERLREALSFLMKTKWKSVDRDNMEFEGRVTCYQLERARAALKD